MSRKLRNNKEITDAQLVVELVVKFGKSAEKTFQSFYLRLFHRVTSIAGCDRLLYNFDTSDFYRL